MFYAGGRYLGGAGSKGRRLSECRFVWGGWDESLTSGFGVNCWRRVDWGRVSDSREAPVAERRIRTRAAKVLLCVFGTGSEGWRRKGKRCR